MKKIAFIIIFFLMGISIQFDIDSSPIHVNHYLADRFPAVFSLYLSSLADLDEREMEFVDLLEALPENEQRRFVQEVYEKGFSLKILESLREWQGREKKPFLHLSFPSQSPQTISASPLYIFGSTEPSEKVKVTVNGVEVQIFDPRTGHFLSLVEIPPEVNFIIQVTAKWDHGENTIEKTVFLPSGWQEMPINPLAIHPTHFQPKQDQILKVGDQLRVIVQGSPDASAVFQIGQHLLDIPMEEVNNLKNLPDGRGIYKGVYTVLEEDVRFINGETGLPVIITLSRDNLKVQKELPGSIRFLEEFPLRVFRVIGKNARIYQVRDDIFQLFGSTIGGNGLSTQLITHSMPVGTFFELVGISGQYLNIDLGGESYLIHADDAEEITGITGNLDSKLNKISISEMNYYNEVRFHLQDNIPFLIDEEQNTMRIKLFHINRSEIINLEGNSSLIERLEINPVYQQNQDYLSVDIFFKKPLSGFSCQWDENDLVVYFPDKSAISEGNPLKNKKIVIDPGHGGESTGAIGPGDIHEKDVVLEIARYLKSFLQENGSNVLMTRDKDVYVSLQERIDLAIQQEADLFISIHANAHAIGADAVNYHGHMTIYNYHFNQKVADRIMDRLTKRIGLPKARVWQRNDLVVLRSSQVPSVMVETAYLMHPEDNWFLLQPIFQREFALAIMEGISDYFQEMTYK